MTQNLGKQPIVVSLMIRFAIKSLFCPALARLPEDIEARETLATEVKEDREMWRQAVQTEAWASMRFANNFGFNPDKFQNLLAEVPLSKKLSVENIQSLLQIDCNRFASNIAEQVEATEWVASLKSSDLIVQKMQEVRSRYHPIFSHAPLLKNFASIFEPDYSRAWLRLNAYLLLREQTELIRSIRTQVRNGKSGRLDDIPSLVIPESHWQISADAMKRSATLRLDPIPSWIRNSSVIPRELFLLALDGTCAWDYGNASDQGSRAGGLQTTP